MKICREFIQLHLKLRKNARECTFLLAIDGATSRRNFLSALAETRPATVDRVAALKKDFSLRNRIAS